MRRIFHGTLLFILLFSLVCIPAISEALTVKISEVSPTWQPEASTKKKLSVAWVEVTISGIDKRLEFRKNI